MHSPQFQPLPAPTRGSDTYGALRAAQAPASRAAALREALALMHERGEAQIHAATPARALRLLDVERRTGRVTMPPAPTS